MMNHTRRITPKLTQIALLLALSSGCGTGPETSAVKVVGADWNQVIAHDDANNPSARNTVALIHNNQIFCSGSLIGPHHVLTAAHCFLKNKDRERMEVGFGARLFEKDFQRRKLKSVAIYADAEHREGVDLFPINDVAIVSFDGPVFPDSQPLPILQAPERDLHDDATFIIAGYGHKTLDRSDNLDRLQSGSAGLREYHVKGAHKGLLVTKKRGGIAACNGDSGGPLYYKRDGVWTIAGTLSGYHYALNSDLPQGASSCAVGETIYNLSGEFSEWILDQLGDAATKRVERRIDFNRNPRNFQEYCEAGNLNLAERQFVYALFARTYNPSCQNLPERLSLIRDLKISNPGAADIKALQYLDNFENLEVDLDVPPLLSPLATHANLRSLLIKKSTRDLSGELSQLRSLRVLKVNAVDSMNTLDLAELTQLQTLHVTNSGLKQLKLPKEGGEVQELNLVGNQLTHLNFLAGSEKLKTLAVSRNQIHDIAALASVVNLSELMASQNQIADIAALARLPGLRIISLADNLLPESIACPVQEEFPGEICFF